MRFSPGNSCSTPPFKKNGFVVGCERTHDAVLIDPGDDVDQLLAAVRDRELEVQYILLTHAHLDHISGVAAAKAALDVPVYLHHDDLFLYERVVEQGTMFGFKVSPQPSVDVFYDMTPIFFGDFEVRVHHTPGHCPGGVCLQIGVRGEAGRDLFVAGRARPLSGRGPGGPAPLADAWGTHPRGAGRDRLFAR